MRIRKSRFFFISVLSIFVCCQWLSQLQKTKRFVEHGWDCSSVSRSPGCPLLQTYISECTRITGGGPEYGERAAKPAWLGCEANRAENRLSRMLRQAKRLQLTPARPIDSTTLLDDETGNRLRPDLRPPRGFVAAFQA